MKNKQAFSLPVCTELPVKSIESLKRQQTIFVFFHGLLGVCCGWFLLSLALLSSLLNFTTKWAWGLDRSTRSAHRHRTVPGFLAFKLVVWKGLVLFQATSASPNISRSHVRNRHRTDLTPACSVMLQGILRRAQTYFRKLQRKQGDKIFLLHVHKQSWLTMAALCTGCQKQGGFPWFVANL